VSALGAVGPMGSAVVTEARVTEGDINKSRALAV
jgi:hypothetical protein